VPGLVAVRGVDGGGRRVSRLWRSPRCWRRWGWGPRSDGAPAGRRHQRRWRRQPFTTPPR